MYFSVCVGVGGGVQGRWGGGGGSPERKEGEGSIVEQSTITAVVCITGRALPVRRRCLNVPFKC